MSCPGDNYVVPGANPCNQGGKGGGGVNTISTGDGIFDTGTAADPILSTKSEVVLVGNTESVAIDLVTLTITNIIELTFSMAAKGDVIINGNATVKSLVGAQNDISYYCEIDGNMIQSAVQYDTISGNGHYRTLSMTGNAFLNAGTHTAIFYVITTAGTNEHQVSSRNLNATINLLYL
jgi:hypothetical protein